MDAERAYGSVLPGYREQVLVGNARARISPERSLREQLLDGSDIMYPTALSVIFF